MHANRNRATNDEPASLTMGHFQLLRKTSKQDIVIKKKGNGYETRHTPLLYVFVDLTVHNVQKHFYDF